MLSLNLSPAEAATEQLNRRKARRNLIPFTSYTLPRYRAAYHHHLIAAKLEAVERGEIPRLMILMPPRHGKSELASRRFPAYYLGRNPERDIIAASYNSDLANDFGREVRNIIHSDAYQALFETRLAEDSRAANRWHTHAGGAYVAAGVGTATTGRGAHVALIDDPLKDREEADSELKRDRLWNWYSAVIRTRLQPGGAVVVIQTRWHEDDLSGRLLETQPDLWDVLKLPAINAKGEALWPEHFPLPELEGIRAEISPRDWSALYQQEPSPDEGTYFRRDWFRFYRERPRSLSIYGASDYAVTDGGGDYTVHVVVGVDENGNIFLIDHWRGQSEADIWIERFLDFVEFHQPLMWGEEQGQIIKSLGPFINQRMDERGVYCAREQFTSVADKPTRARSFQARAAMGKVYLPDLPWAHELLDRILPFPAGKHDDDVDTLGLIGRLLDKMVTASRVTKDEALKRDRWDRAFDEYDTDQNWKTL